MSQLFRIALPGIVTLCWLVSSVQAQVGPSVLPQRGSAPATGPAPTGLRTQQIVDSLQRLTRPGYYTALFMARKSPAPSPNANARLRADACNTYLCTGPVAPLSVSLTSSGPLTCPVASATLTATSNPATGGTYTFAGPDGAVAGSGNTAVVTKAGTYTVIFSQAGSQPATATATVTDSRTLTATISGALTVCAGGTTNLTASGGDTFLWSTQATTATVSVTAGAYSVTVTTGSCQAMTSANVSTTQCAPTNTAPVATANASQTATAGRTFSYTVNAFTDAETPNSLTYSASLDPATLGLTFDPATRVISGTPSQPGPVSVTITATDPGGLSASTSFTISVGPRIVSSTPLRVTLTASPQTLLTTGSTVLRATASGGNVGAPPSGYTYNFSGPGDFAASQANEVTVTNLPAGVQTFTVVVSDATQPVSQTTSATVSVTVTAPTATAALRVLHQDADNGQMTNNAIKPNLQIENTGTTPIDYGQLTLRYWLTVEQFSPMTNLQVYYAQLGTNKVKMKYVGLDKPRQGALGYVEYSFNSSPGNLGPGANSGPIQSGIAKQDYSNFNEADDYSYANTRSLTANTRITAYLDGKLVWGTEPAEVAVQQLIKAYTESRSSGANTISTYLQVRNEGNVPVDYKDVKVRYYFTSEGAQPLNFYLDYAALGNNKIASQSVRLSPALNQADTYLELSFSPSLGTFSPATSTGNIQYRIAKQDWSNFTQSNDHSYQNGTQPLTENDRVVVYVSGVRVWGNEPGAGARIGGRIGTEEYDASLRVTVLGNPVQGATANVEVRGAEGQPLRLQLTDLSGRLVSQQVVEQAGAVERHTIGLGTQPAGLLLLQVSTPTQKRTVKLIKAE